MRAMNQEESSVATLTLECESCGATLSVEEHLRTIECPYCDSPGVVERPPDPNRPRPTFAVGFVLTGSAAAERVSEWVKSRGIFAHGGLKTATVDTVRGVYLPGYLFGATAHASYSAQIGENYTVTETYTTTDSEGRTVTRTRTRIETEWRPLSGNYSGYVQDVVVTASRAISNDELEEIEPFDLRGLRRYDHGLVAGWIAEEPSRSRAECQALAEEEGLQDVGQRIARFLPGDSQRSVQFTSELRDQVLELTLLPVWVFAARYAPDRPPVRVLVNGQTGKVYGDVPLSKVKIAIAVILVLAFFGGIFALVMASQ
jgi:DNA-directed RNA polymerase subunit RPC12/RpoP